MKPGTRVLGIAESYRGEESTVAAAVVTTDGRVEDIAFASCTVGGLDVTEAIVELWNRLGREDVRLCCLSGIALAHFNIVDLDAIASSIPAPFLALTYEESEGLVDHIRAAFPPERAVERVELYRSLPERRTVTVEGATVYVRVAGSTEVDAESMLAALDWTGSRPEPIRVARAAARAGDRWRNRCG